MDRYSRIQWLAQIFNLTVPSRAHVNRSRGCDFSRKRAQESFGSGLASTSSDDGPPWVRRRRAEEDAALGKILRPWQDAVEKLIKLHGLQISRPPNRADAA